MGYIDEATENAQKLLEFAYDIYYKDEKQRFHISLPKVLVDTAPYLSETSVRKAIEIAKQLEGDKDRASVLATLMLQLANLGYHQEVLTIIDESMVEIRDQIFIQLMVSAEIIPHLSAEMRPHILQKTQEAIHSTLVQLNLNTGGSGLRFSLDTNSTEPVAIYPTYRDKTSLKAIIAFASLLATPDQIDDLITGLVLTDNINWRWWFNSKEKQKNLATLVYHITRDLKPEVGWAALNEIPDLPERAKIIKILVPNLSKDSLDTVCSFTRNIGDDEIRHDILRTLALRMSELPRYSLYSLWQQTLHSLTSRNRKSLLSDLIALLPVLIVLGGKEGIEETISAIDDVGRWWP